VRGILRRRAPLFGARFALPTRRDVDARLVAGAALFGAGWGLVGYCPGPAVTALGGGVPAAAIFVPAMVAGMWVFHALFERAEQRQRLRFERYSHTGNASYAARGGASDSQRRE
jgi:uncharacterized membrane protein YedE/YeeE